MIRFENSKAESVFWVQNFVTAEKIKEKIESLNRHLAV